jgi:hypothetical protein
MSQELIIQIILGIASLVVAIFFGDRAGTRAAIKHEKEKDAWARLATLHVLFNEVGRIRELAKLNAALTDHGSPQAIASMPTETFKSVLLSRESSLLYPETSAVLLTEALVYLVKADIINYHNDAYTKLIGNLATVSGVSKQKQAFVTRIIDESQQVLEILDRLKDSIKNEMQKKSP